MFIACLLGLCIGWERETKGKSIGIRTCSLVCLGSTLFTLMSPEILSGDNSRIIAQIPSAMGFLCAAVIVKDGNTISGLTTSATVWITAAIGALVGCNMLAEAMAGTVLTIGVNYLISVIKNGNKKVTGK